jgi:hypothetical protein
VHGDDDADDGECAAQVTSVNWIEDRTIGE